MRLRSPRRTRPGPTSQNGPWPWASILRMVSSHKTGATTFGQRFFNLAPTGREIDYEVAYGFGLLGGSLDLNAFVRSDPGHIEAMPRDTGAAIRFTLSN